MYKKYWTYIMSNNSNTTLYIGVTDNLEARVQEHRSNERDSFTHRYCCHKLVYYEQTSDVRSAIEREKQLKGWNRARKNKLVETMNPGWLDLWESIQ